MRIHILWRHSMYLLREQFFRENYDGSWWRDTTSAVKLHRRCARYSESIVTSVYNCSLLYTYYHDGLTSMYSAEQYRRQYQVVFVFENINNYVILSCHGSLITSIARSSIHRDIVWKYPCINNHMCVHHLIERENKNKKRRFLQVYL